MRTHSVPLILFCLLCFCGCGGNSPSQPQTTPVKFDIAWADRTRAVAAPASALSATLVLKGALTDHKDLTFSVDRSAALAAYTQTVTSTDSAALGTWNATITFYANKGGQGSVVGVASKSVTLKADGTGIGEIVTVGTVASVMVPTGQTLLVGVPGDLVFTALDAGNNLLALTSGSGTWSVSTGTDILQVTPAGTATGISAGSATVTVTVDGKTSAPVAVTIQSVSTPVPAVVAEATSIGNIPSVRIRLATSVFGNVTVKQLQLFRTPDFPPGAGSGGSGGGIGGGTGSVAIPIAVGAPNLTELADQPSPYFPYQAGVNLLTPGAVGCGTTPLFPQTDTGFAPGRSYRYQLEGATVQNGSAVCSQTDPVQSGTATPIVPVALTTPANNTTAVDLRQFSPTFPSRQGADLFQIEVSTDSTFKKTASIFFQQFISSAPNADGVSQSPSPIDLSTSPALLLDPTFANFVNHVSGAPAPHLYWRVGARNNADVPGPVHAISADPNDPDRTFRWIYSSVFTFTPQ